MIIPQELIIAKSKQLHETVDQLVTIVADAIQQQTPVHEVEKSAFKTLLKAGLATIQMLVDCLGTHTDKRSNLCPGRLPHEAPVPSRVEDRLRP